MNHLERHLRNLQKLRKELHKFEANRKLLSQQSALITEAEALGTALGSHPLNTLSQRYSVYKRTRDEFNACRQSLLDKSGHYSKQMVDYTKCLETVESHSMAEYLVELNELLVETQIHQPTYEFDLVKAFLDNSAQSAIYLQSCQISNDLHITLLQQLTVIKETLDTLLQYGTVIRYYPASAHSQHRMAKYSEWSQYLSEHKSVPDCREVVTQFHTSIGKNAINKIPLQQVVTFSYQLQSFIRDGQFKLQKCMERLEVEAAGADVEAFLMSYERAKVTIAAKMNGSSDIDALQCVSLNVLCDLNKRLMMMESAASSSGENLVDLTFNGKWFLDELFVHTTSICDLTGFAVSRAGDLDATTLNAVACLKEIQCIYVELQEVNETFCMSILGDIVQGIISEDTSVLEMISAVSSLQEGLLTVPELLTNLHLNLRRNAMSSNGSSGASSLVESTTAQACADVVELKRRLNDMKMRYELEDGASAGKKLFLAFYAMFEQLDKQHLRIIDRMHTLNVIGDRKKIDQIKDSKDMAVS